MTKNLTKALAAKVGLDEGETFLEILWCGLGVAVLEGLERFILWSLLK